MNWYKIAKEEEQLITHGTWIKNLKGILDNGLKAGSAIDYGCGWSSEYPVILVLKNVERGAYISHNKYYVCANSPDIASVTLNLGFSHDAQSEAAVALLGHTDIPIYANKDGKWIESIGADFGIYHGTGGEEVIDDSFSRWNKTRWHDGDYYAVEEIGGKLHGEEGYNLPIYDNLEDAESFVIQNSAKIKTQGPYDPVLKGKCLNF
jgi:hypothetical protein